MADRIQKKSARFSAVESKRHFVQIGLKVLRADLMPRANDAALEQRECGFDGVGVDVAANILLRLVIDGLMLPSVDSSFNHRGGIPRQFIGDHDLHIGAYVFLDVLCQCAGLRIFGMEEPERSPAFADADNDFFLILAVANALASLFPADVGFVHLDRAGQHRLIDLLHGVPDAMAQVPRGFIRAFVLAPEGTLELKCAHPFFGFAYEECRQEPCREGQVSIVENRVAENAKLVFTLDAFKLLLGTDLGYGCAFAARTFNTVRPS